MHTKHRNRTNRCGFRHVIDAPAEKYFSESPYSYAGNDPVNKYDVAGLQYYRKKEERQTENHFSGGGIMYSINYWNNRMGFNLSGHFVTVVTETWEDVWDVDKEGNHINFLGTQKVSESSRTVWVWDDKKTDGNGDPPDGGDGDKTNKTLNTINNYVSITGLFSYAEYGIMNSKDYLNGTWQTFGNTNFKFQVRNPLQFNRSLEALGAAKWFKYGGRGLGLLSTGLYVIDGVQAYNTGDNAAMGKAAVNATMSLVMTFGGIPGLIIGGVYFVGDAYGFWDGPTGNLSNPYPNNVTRIDNTYVTPPIIHY